MGKQQLDKAKLDRSRQWLREAGAKNMVEALIIIDPDLKLSEVTMLAETKNSWYLKWVKNWGRIGMEYSCERPLNLTYSRGILDTLN